MSSLQLSLVALLISWAVFSSCSAENILYTNDALYGGQSLTWGNYRLTMQTDCNLVLYDGGNAVWSSGTYNQGSGCYAKMQSDGNLVVYGGYNNALWATNTEREQGNYICVLQRDRNVVIYGPALWASGTNRVGTPGVVISAANSTQTAAATTESKSPSIAMVTN
ncbi:mannose-specific lectin-like [Ananas comosus]|uniref:non-specific serine/threonine protein kinase n=1 Tax=Ananas comosus TaxID=4615 RepID=A0A6P5FZS4_ANACO|nr:mannose-specific lectin-like [Ananas comosus]